MMTKKILALLLALLTVAALASCKKEESEKGSLSNYKKDEVVYTSYTDEDGNTFYFETLDSDSVAITGYAGSDKPHPIVIPSKVRTGVEDSTVKNVSEIAKGAFATVSSITSVEIPEGVTAIGDLAFSMCAQLHSVKLPSTLETLGRGSFSGCGLTELNLPETCGVKTIPDFCFSKCTALTKVTVPAFIETVGDAAFFECAGLKEIVISEGVKSVGKQAFQGTVSLEKLTLPSTFTNTDPDTDYAFYGSKILYRDSIVCPENSVAEAYVSRMPLSERPEA